MMLTLSGLEPDDTTTKTSSSMNYIHSILPKSIFSQASLIHFKLKAEKIYQLASPCMPALLLM
jgi:hypothetical protein